MDYQSVSDWLKSTQGIIYTAEGQAQEAREEWTENPPQALNTVVELLKLARAEIFRLRLELKKVTPEEVEQQ